MYDEEERRQELLRRRAIRRRHKMREKRRRVRRRRFMLSVLVAAIVLFCLIRLGMLAYSAIHSRIDKTEQQAEQTEQIQSEKQTEQTESSYSMAIITTAAGLNVRTGPGTTYPRVTTLSGGTILSTDAEKDNWSQIAEGTYVNDWLCSDYISRLRQISKRLHRWRQTMSFGCCIPQRLAAKRGTRFKYKHISAGSMRTASASMKNTKRNLLRAARQLGDYVFI